jgi:hypothetical protein
METLRKHKTAALLLVAVVIVSLLFKRSSPILIYLVGLLVAYFPIKTSFLDSIAFRFVISLVAVLCLFQMEAMLFWLVDIRFAPIIYILISLAVVGLALWMLNKRGELTLQKPRLRRLDILLILPSLLIGGVYVFGALAPSEKDDATIVRSVMFGMDDATHANIFSDVLREDSSILAGDERSKLMNKSVHASYPMGWHVSTSIVAESVAGSKTRTPIENIKIYFYAKVLTLMLTIASVTIFVYALARKLWQPLHYLVTMASVWGISIFISSVLVLPLFFDGFFSFMPILLYTLLFAVILMKEKIRTADVALLTLLAAASSLTWMLTGPILILAIAIYFFDAYGSLRKIPRSVYASIIVSGFFLLSQAYILYSANKNSLQNISNVGGIANPDHLLLAAGLLAFFAVWLGKDKSGKQVTNSLFSLVVAFAVALGALLAYLTLKTPEITYYFYKLQMPLLIVLVPLLCVYLFKVLFGSDWNRRFINQVILCGVGFVLLGMSIPGLVGYDFVHTTVNRAHSYGISSSDARILTEDVLNRPVSSNNERVYFVFPSQASRNILSSNVEKLGYRSTSCDYDLFAAVYNYDLRALSTDLERCVPELPRVKIYTNEDGKRQILETVSPTLIDSDEVQLVVI